jgi:hypothetical protein
MPEELPFFKIIDLAEVVTYNTNLFIQGGLIFRDFRLRRLAKPVGKGRDTMTKVQSGVLDYAEGMSRIKSLYGAA